MSADLDPIVVELAAFELLRAELLKTDGAPPVEESEAVWRQFAPGSRNAYRNAAKRLLQGLLDNGVAVRAGKKCEAALRDIMTVPAHAAYELPASGLEGDSVA